MPEIAFLRSSSKNEAIMKFVYTFEGHLKLIQSCLYSQWTEGTFCDLELHTCDGSIPVHAWLFACFSPKIAAVLNDSVKGQNSKKPDSVLSVNIFFTYDVVKIIVEAIYSGIFTATFEKLGELQAVLQWLEMHELEAVIKCIQERVEKENLIGHDKKSLLHDLGKSEQCKSLRITQTSKFCTRNTAINQGSQNKKLVSLLKNNPLLLALHKQKRKGTVSDKSIAGQENLSLEKDKEMSADLLSADSILNTATSHTDLFDNEHLPEPQYDNSLENSIEMNILTPIATESPKVGLPGEEQQRKSNREKSTEQVKSEQTQGRPPQLEDLSQMSSQKINPQLPESASEKISSDIMESEEEKKKYATEALMIMRTNIVKEEFPEVETFEAVIGEVKTILSTDFIKCDKCTLSFSSLDEYNQHVENHPTYTCEKCSRVFCNRSSLVRHVRGAHLKSMHLKCSECDFIAKDDKDLEQHCAKVHEEFQPFKCLFEGCKFKTTKYRYLTRHFENHEDKNFRSYVCEKCHRTFKKNCHLYSHRRSCYHVQSFLCDMCGQSFNHHTSMKIHRRTMHFGEKPYGCKICLKSFSNGANLRRHMRIHNNSFPYSCSICMKQFRHSNTLKLHIGKHKVVDSSTVTSQTEQRETTTFSCNSTSFHHQSNSSASATNSSVQLCSIPSSTPSLSTVLSTMPTNDGVPQVYTMPPFTKLPSMPSNKSIAVSVRISDVASSSYLQYDNQLPWQEAENYHPSTL